MRGMQWSANFHAFSYLVLISGFYFAPRVPDQAEIRHAVSTVLLHTYPDSNGFLVLIYLTDRAARHVEYSIIHSFLEIHIHIVNNISMQALQSFQHPL